MITADQVQAIADRVKQFGLDDNTVFKLRQDFPDLHFTYCMDDDLSNKKPVLEQAAFNLYLVDGREHCLCLTNDYEIATGVVVAELIPE